MRANISFFAMWALTHPLASSATARFAQVKGAAHSTFEKAKEVNEEHKVVDKAKAGASRAWGRIKEVGFS